MAYKFQSLDAILSGAISPALDDAFDLGASDNEWKDLYIDGTANIDTLAAGASTVTSLSSSLDVDILGGRLKLGGVAVTADSAELNKLDGVTATTAEINYLDITTLGTAEASKALTIKGDSTWTVAGMTCADLGTVTTADINGGSMDGVTIGAASAAAATVSSLSVSDGNITNVGDVALDSISADDGSSFSFGSNWTAASRTCADLGTVTTADINGGSMDGVTIGAASAAAGTFTSLSASSTVDILGGQLKLAGVAVSADATELNYLDGSTPGTAVASKVVTLDASKDISGLNQVSAVGLSGTLRYSLDVAADGGIGMTPFQNSANVNDMKLSASYIAAGAIAVAEDQFMFYDADGSVKRESFVDLATAMAGAGISATNGVLSADSSATPVARGDANVTLSEGFNYGSATLTANRTWTLPAGDELGDAIVVKAPENVSTFAITVAAHADNTIDGMPFITLASDAAAVTLTYVVSGSWKIS